MEQEISSSFEETKSASEVEDEKEPKKSKFKKLVRYVFGETLEEIFGTLRKIVWFIAVVVCCFFMVSQVSF